MTADKSNTLPDLVDTVVVGAGYSGLIAASVLQREGRDVVVLEARDRVGGRTLSVKCENGAVVDLGAQWIGSPHRRLETWRKRLGLKRVRAPKSRPEVRSPQGDVLAANKLLAGGLRSLSGAALPALKELQAAAPWEHSQAEQLDNISLTDWIRQHVDDEQQRAIIDHAVRSSEGEDLSYISALALLKDINGMGGIKGLSGAEDYMFKDGSQELALRLAEQLGERVKLSHRVDQVECNDDEAWVRGPWGTIRARHVIVAMPPSFASKITASIGGSKSVERADVSQGAVIKAVAAWDRNWWKREKLNVQQGTLDNNVMVRQILEGSRNKHGILVCLIVGDTARRANELDPADLHRQVRDAFSAAVGPEGPAPEEVHIHNWLADEWTRGGYGEKPAIGSLTRHHSNFAEPIGRVHFAGTETATQWSGFLEGAIQAGERAASEVLALP